jgi:hypothetical protein
MSGPELILDIGIVAAALVDVVDDEGDGRAGGHLATGIVGEHAREDAHLVRLATLGGEARLAGTAPIEERLDLVGCQWDAGRAAVNDAADRWSVALAPGGDAKEMAKRVVGHRRRPFCGAKSLIAEGFVNLQRAGMRSSRISRLRTEACATVFTLPQDLSGLSATRRTRLRRSHLPFI